MNTDNDIRKLRSLLESVEEFKTKFPPEIETDIGKRTLSRFLDALEHPYINLKRAIDDMEDLQTNERQRSQS